MADGNIRDFEIDIHLPGAGTCTITLKEIAVEADGAFLVGELDSDGTLKKNGIRGKFNAPTTLTGAYSKLLFCENTISMFSQEGTWSAEWKGQ